VKWSKLSDWHGYVMIKVTDIVLWKNWKVEHIYNVEQDLWIEINTKTHCVHHINWKKDDNDLENLCLMTHNEHKSLHNTILNSVIKELIDKNIVFFDKSEKIYKVRV